MDKIKILVVDDESRMRKLVKDFLSVKGFTVLEAGDGEEAVDIFFEQKFTLCISDNKSLNLHRFRLLLRQFDRVLVISSIEIGCTEKANRAFVGSWIFS